MRRTRPDAGDGSVTTMDWKNIIDPAANRSR
jgi:hypothetical protein